MAVARKTRRTVEDYADELKRIIREQAPDAEFELHRARAKEYDLVIRNKTFDDLFDTLPVTAERATDILVESGIHIHVLPLGRGVNRDS